MLLGEPGQASVAGTPGAAPAGQLTVVVLPTQALVWKPGFNKPYLVDDWSATARANLDAAVEDAVGQSEKFRAVQMPPVTPEERDAIDDFMSVAELAVAHRGSERQIWKPDDTEPADDRTLGPTLQFLRDRAGADLALGVVGTQVEFTKTQVAVQSTITAAAAFVDPFVLLAGPGPLPAIKGNHAVMVLVDLRTGELQWFNVRRGYAIVGLHTWNLLDADSARKVVQDLLGSFPDTPPTSRTTAGTPPAPISLDPKYRASPIVGEFSLKVPAEWKVTTEKVAVAASSDDIPLTHMAVELRSHVRAFPSTGQKSAPKSDPTHLAEQFADELRAQPLTDLQILETSTEATLAGKPAFRIRFTYWSTESTAHPRMEQVVLGTAVSHGLLLAKYAAPQLLYFEQSLPAFEESVQTLALEPHRTMR